MKLIHFLLKLVREIVTIELKDNTVVKGTVVSVDSAMNTHLRLVHIKTTGQEEQRPNNLAVCGASIRYVILPDVLNLDTPLVDDLPLKTRMRYGEVQEERERRAQISKPRK